MTIRCFLSFHNWVGCKCSVCGKTRDEGHEWNKDCEKCVRCGGARTSAHKWAGCRCSTCGKTRDQDHDWKNGRCTRCGANAPSLHEAASRGDTEIARALLAGGADVNARDIDGATPLIAAVEKGQRDVVRLLLASKTDVNAKNGGGQTALHVAAIVGHKNIAELLLASKAGIDSKDKKGNTPLHYAATHGHREVAEVLLHDGANIKAKNDQGHWTPLLIAARNGCKDVAELLLASHADVNARDDEGWTSLHLAAEQGHEKVAEVLLANRADVDPANGVGMTPLIIGAAHGSREVVRLLLGKGAEVNAKGDHGWTPLQEAAHGGHMEVAELLLANHAEVSAENEYGWTPLHYAADEGHIGVARLLLAKGADVNASRAVEKWRDHESQTWKQKARENGKTPLFFATKGGHKDIAELLSQRATAPRGANAPTKGSPGTDSNSSTGGGVVRGADGSSLWCRPAGDRIVYLRFYSDGTVIWTITNDNLDAVERWFHKPKGRSGTYSVIGSLIKFSIPEFYSQVDYEGVSQGNTLQLTEFCNRDKKSTKTCYELVDRPPQKQPIIIELPDTTKELTDFDLFRLLGDRPIARNVAVMFATTRSVVGGRIGLVDLYFENGIVLWNVRITQERMVTIPAAYGAFPIRTVGVANLERHREGPPMRAERE